MYEGRKKRGGQKHRRRCAALLCAFALAVCLLAACGGAESSSSSPGVSISGNYAFKIDGETCSLAEAKVFLLNYQNQCREIYGMDLSSDNVQTNSELETYIKDLTISQLAEIYMLNLLAKDRGTSLTEEEEANAAAAAEAYYASLNEAETEYLGISESKLEALYGKYALAQKVYQEITDGVDDEVSDDDARVVSLQQILVADADTAQEVYASLENGEEFSVLAAKYNEASETSFYADRFDFDDETEEIIFSLSTGSYTEVIVAEEGYCIYYCVNAFMEEMTEENKSVVLETRICEALDAAYAAYDGSLSVDLNEEKWDEVEVSMDPELQTQDFFDIYQEYCQAEEEDV